MLLAADDDKLHADREHSRADVGVVATRDHDLRLDSSLDLLHRGQIVNRKRAAGSVDGSEWLGPALPGHLVPPHEVHRSARQVG